MKKITFLIMLLGLILVQCHREENKDNNKSKSQHKENIDSTIYKFPEKEIPHASPFEVRTFETERGWGYAIYKEGKLFINQHHIPAIPGNKGFSSEQKARVCGEYAMHKLANTKQLPSLSENELDSLEVLD